MKKSTIQILKEIVEVVDFEIGSAPFGQEEEAQALLLEAREAISESREENPPRFIACVVTYHGPTESRGSRVKLTLPRFKKSRVIPFDHSFNNSSDIASAFFHDMGIPIAGTADGITKSDLLLFTWENLPALESVFKF